MEKRADLHVHTYYSDGTFSPEEAVKCASERNLAAIAICDHDTTDGLKESMESAQKYGIEIIPGAEITSEKDGIEIHILAYFIDPDEPALKKMLEDLRKSRIKRIYDMVEKLKAHGIIVSPEKVFALSGKGSVGRLHLAKTLHNEGLVPNIREAFNKYLGDNAPCYVRRFNLSPEESIRIILKSGGIPVYAHPRVMGRDDFIPGFLKAGLRGLECYHTDQSKKITSHYINMANKLGLIITGGSDCHGLGKQRILMGGVTVPYSVVETLKKEAKEIACG